MSDNYAESEEKECGCKGCCTYPHSPKSIATLILSVMAYILSQNATWNCYYVQSEMNLTGNFLKNTEFAGSTVKIGLGPFSREDLTEDLSCIMYSADDVDMFLDAPYKTSRIFGAFANLLLGITMIALICTSCMSFYPIAMKAIGVLSIMGSLCLAMTFLIFSSDLCEDCSFHIGAGVALVGTAIAMINGCFVMALPPAKL
mmetsp:Transcript_5128/g.15015  ORF Transcript_5128/g.15015 Transcript_5128/m.15015 type:complete len:201 (+) Transcript_5128:126-728(+)|eukprot:CAMPEP_0119549844 /NCGR_PEP_ID=MMETSP1352-20130426/3474_1 /TAXON_ID=265584 /ORGANISM="Stauroneis constricta, Strain CCMP1120" /LENGTH=200 /DNA_ID=CAMNT_0007595517 /DNA_START=52 /DNA_END=654 /DNA_ORIENTATION=+